MVNKGSTLIDLERYEESIKYFDKVLEIQPNNITALVNKGVALQELKKYEEAMVSYNQVLKIDKNNDNIYYQKASIESLRKNKKEALRLLGKAIELNEKTREKVNMDTKFNNIKDLKEFKELVFPSNS